MPTTTSDGVEIWWGALGGPDLDADGADAETVVLVPGRGDSSDIWPPEFRDPLVAASFRVLVFDPRDTGRSGASDDYDLTAMADDVVAVLDAAGVEREQGVGLSMGGFLEVDLATRYRDRCATLVFLSAMSPDPDAGFGPQFFGTDATDPVEALLAAMEAPSATDRAWVTAHIARAAARTPLRLDAGDRHQAAAFRSEFPSLDRLAEIDAPALVVHGRDDQVLPVAHAEAYAAGIAGARLMLVDDMGHIPKPAQWTLVADAAVTHLSATTTTDAPAA